MNAFHVKNIFIVDDDKLLTDMLKDYLISKNVYQVSVFQTGEDCLNHLVEKPDIIILDYYLNNINKAAANGMEILEKIKEILPEVYIIVLSSQDRYSIARQTIQKGAEQYLVKDKNAFETIANMIKETV